MPVNPPECTQCGWCCVDLLNTFDASDEDIARWEQEGRNDILKYIGADGNLFVDPATSDHVPLFCPFISFDNVNRIATCQIHYTKPDVCIDFSCWSEKNGRFQIRFGDQFHPKKGYELIRRKIRREWLNYLRQLTQEPSPFIYIQITVGTSRLWEIPHAEAMRLSGLAISVREYDPENTDVLNLSLLPKGCTTDRATIKRYIIERLEQQCE